MNSLKMYKIKSTFINSVFFFDVEYLYNQYPFYFPQLTHKNSPPGLSYLQHGLRTPPDDKVICRSRFESKMYARYVFCLSSIIMLLLNAITNYDDDKTNLKMQLLKTIYFQFIGLEAKSVKTFRPSITTFYTYESLYFFLQKNLLYVIR